MAGNERQSSDFEAVKSRLEEIADAVDNENTSLDEALDLFEEAVALGVKVSDLIEEGISVDLDELQEGAGPSDPITGNLESASGEVASAEPVSHEADASGQAISAASAARE